MPVCNLDCFNCTYSDCINEGDLSERKLDASLDRAAKQDCKLTPYQKYRKSEKGKAAVHRYNTSDAGKAHMNKYNHSEKGKARSKIYEQTEQRKLYRREWQRRKYWERKLNAETNNS